MKNQGKVLLGLLVCVFVVSQQLMPGLVPVRAIILRNDTFETDLGDWQKGAGTSVVRDNTRAHGGTWSALGTSADTGFGFELSIETDFAACSGSTQCWLSIWAYKEEVTDEQVFEIIWYDDTSSIGSSTIQTNYKSSTGWFEITWTDTSPASANRYRIELWMNDMSAFGWTLNIDDAQFWDSTPRHNTFETDLEDWQLDTGDSFVRDNTRAHGGSWSALANAKDIGDGEFYIKLVTAFDSCSSSTPYWLSIWTYKEQTTEMELIRIEWFDDSASSVGQSDVPTDYKSSTGWFEITWSGTSPESATRYRIWLRMIDLDSDWTLTIDDAQFSDTSLPEFTGSIALVFSVAMISASVILLIQQKKQKKL